MQEVDGCEKKEALTSDEILTGGIYKSKKKVVNFLVWASALDPQIWKGLFKHPRLLGVPSGIYKS